MSACTIVSVISIISELPWVLTLHFPRLFQSERWRFVDLLEKLFLAWVGTYISKFGGDPDKVTL